MKTNAKKEDFETPLTRARGLGAAHKGTGHWITLRITALALIPLTVWLVYNLVDLSGADYASFYLWLARPVNAVLMISFVLAGFYHAALGAQEIAEDYVHHTGLRLFAITGVNLLLCVTGAACIFSVLKVALAGI